VGKRSPILGYNHNVRYRGLVFHVQTEDSGVASPHLFTHLFHNGVIVSTRKLVYDAGSAEESIKSLMQAQHKAALKDLRRGHFDDKIDSYLGGTPGLLPRGAEEPPERPSEIDLAPSQGTVEEVAAGAPTKQVRPTFDEQSDAITLPDPPRARPTPPAVPRRAPAERPPPPVEARNVPMDLDATLRTAAPLFDSSPEIGLLSDLDLELELEDDAATPLPRRISRDTDAQRPTLDVRFDDHTKPTVSMASEHFRPTVNMAAEQPRRASASARPATSDVPPGAIRPSSPSIPPLTDSRRVGEKPSNPAIPSPTDSRRIGEKPSNPAIPLPADSRRAGDRPSTINAATLPPARPIVRPPSRQAMVTPPIVSRAQTPDDRSRREPEAADAYSQAAPPGEAASQAAPPGDAASQAAPPAEVPPGERPGQYAQYKKGPPRLPAESKNERSGAVSIPAGLGRPRMSSPGLARPLVAPPPAGAQPPVSREASQNPGHGEPTVGRAPTPARISPPGTATSRAGTTSGSGVVMTRPAVIVGAPTKPTAGTVPRIRKAREDEGRGFGQGLISEKSLDEVILAYLSEDADDK